MPILTPSYLEDAIVPAEWHREFEFVPRYGMRVVPETRAYERVEGGEYHTETNTALDGAIAASKWIAFLTDNWDGEGSPGYAYATWERASTFLRELSEAARQIGYALPVPDIAPADAGSIDLFWKSKVRSFLINIPALEHEPATFFGQDHLGNTLSGSIVKSAGRIDIAAWIGATR